MSVFVLCDRSQGEKLWGHPGSLLTFGFPSGLNQTAISAVWGPFLSRPHLPWGSPRLDVCCLHWRAVLPRSCSELQFLIVLLALLTRLPAVRTPLGTPCLSSCDGIFALVAFERFRMSSMSTLLPCGVKMVPPILQDVF